MPVLNVRIDEKVKRTLQVRARGQHRSPSEQARRYLELAMIAEDNPDLPFAFIEGILEARAERDAGMLEPVDWSVEA
ncbi:MAG: TA system antitoxin ParD family protein [Armatimonadota bacterium]